MASTRKIADERRAATRFSLAAKVHYMTTGNREGMAMLLDISETGMAVMGAIEAAEGDFMISYVDGIGRIPGKITRAFSGGAGIEFTVTASEAFMLRKKIAAALNGKPYMRIMTPRNGERRRLNIETCARLAGEDRVIECTIDDLSTSGCSLNCVERPNIGAAVSVGVLSGRVVRHTDLGFAIEFGNSGPSDEFARLGA